jgi:hypothetical protein
MVEFDHSNRSMWLWIQLAVLLSLIVLALPSRRTTDFDTEDAVAGGSMAAESLATVSVPGARASSASFVVAGPSGVDVERSTEAQASLDAADALETGASVEPPAAVEPPESVEHLEVEPPAAVEPPESVDPAQSVDPAESVDPAQSADPGVSADPAAEAPALPHREEMT